MSEINTIESGEKKRWKVLFLLNNLGKAGAQRIVLDMANRLRMLGHSVKIVIFTDRNEFPELSKNLDVEVCSSYVHYSFLRKTKADLSDFNRILDEFQPDVVHSNQFNTEILSRENTRSEIRYVSHIHGMRTQFLRFGLKTLFSRNSMTQFYEKRKLLKQYKNCCNYILTNSNYLHAYLKKNLPSYFSDRLHMIHNGFHFKTFENKQPGLKRHGGRFQMISTGALSRHKNQIFLLDVLKALIERGRDVELTILGEGKYRPELEKYAEELGISDYLFLPGLVEEVQNHLHQADLYVHACRNEAFGLSLLEAFASGLPCVALDGKGNRDLMIDGKNGYMIMQENSSLFAEKVMSLIDNEEEYAQMASFSVDYASGFSIDKYCKKLLRFYSEICS